MHVLCTSLICMCIYITIRKQVIYNIDVYMSTCNNAAGNEIDSHPCANDIVHSTHMYTRQADSCTGHTHYMPCMLELHTRCYYNN